MDGSHFVAASVVLFCISGCAVIKTTDVTDASYKRHQSVAVLGWPLYSRITDQDHGVTAQLATAAEPSDDPRVRAAELLGPSIEIEQ
jgi:hypothetical protein